MVQAVKESRLTGPHGTPFVLYEPEAPGTYACVLIMPERYGLVRHIVENAARLATHGFVVGAPDLMYDHPDQESLHAGAIVYRPSDEVILQRVDDVFAALQERKGADTSRFGMVGICQSGRYPFVWGAAHPIQAAVVFYGAARPGEWEPSEVNPHGVGDLFAKMERTNVLGMFGEADHVISISDVLRFRNAMEANKHSYQITLYPNAPHGWIDDTTPERYRPEAAQQAWDELTTFLRVKLAPDYRLHGGLNIDWTFRSQTSPDYDFYKNPGRRLA